MLGFGILIIRSLVAYLLAVNVDPAEAITTQNTATIS